jgi:hypothetical protein
MYEMNRDMMDTMIRDWLADNAEEMADLVVDYDSIRYDEDEWIADAHDDNTSYTLKADNDGFVHIC